MSYLYESYRRQQCSFCARNLPFVERAGSDQPRTHRVVRNHILTHEECKALSPSEWAMKRSELLDEAYEEIRNKEQARSCEVLPVGSGEESS